MFPQHFLSPWPPSYRYFTVKMQLGRKTRDKLAIFSWSRYDCVILDAERLFSTEKKSKIDFWDRNRCPKSNLVGNSSGDK